MAIKRRLTAAFGRYPDGNHGENIKRTMATQSTSSTDRNRLSLDLSDVVSSHLSHISEISGSTKSAIVMGAFLEALPDLLARADALKKRHQELNQVKQRK